MVVSAAMTSTVKWYVRVAGLASVSAGLLACGAGVAAAEDPNAVPQPMLDTQCSLDQLMGATKVVDPVAYNNIVEKYSQEPQWMQQQVILRMNNLLAKDPADRQAEVDQFAIIFPQYASLFRTQESAAQGIATKCVSLPADDPGVWNATPASAPASAAAAPSAAEPAAAGSQSTEPAAPAEPAA